MDGEEKQSYLVPNSHKFKAEQASEKHIEKVVQGKAIKQPESTGHKLSKAIFAEDVKDVKAYLVWDVLIPAFKDTLSDVFKKGIDAILFGDSKPRNVQRNGSSSKISYSSYYEREKERNGKKLVHGPYSQIRYNQRAVHEFSDLVFDRRDDAENVLDQLVELTMNYGVASVADFYEMAGVKSEYTDEKYGWGELSEARVERVRNGYILRLPRPELID